MCPLRLKGPQPASLCREGVQSYVAGYRSMKNVLRRWSLKAEVCKMWVWSQVPHQLDCELWGDRGACESHQGWLTAHRAQLEESCLREPPRQYSRSYLQKTSPSRGKFWLISLLSLHCRPFPPGLPYGQSSTRSTSSQSLLVWTNQMDSGNLQNGSVHECTVKWYKIIFRETKNIWFPILSHPSA